MSNDEYVETWNVKDKDERYKDLVNHTNNTLERYNYSMNKNNASPHPSLLEFVPVIKKKYGQVTRLNNICEGNTTAPVPKEVNIGEIWEVCKN